MTLTIAVHHDLECLQTLACFGLKELQENLFYQKYSFPNSRIATILFPEHFLTKAEAEACIQQYNIGTATMRALLYEYSSSTTAFTVHDIKVYLPADMVASEWQEVIGKLWLSFKGKLTFTMQQEYLLVCSKYPVARVRPFSGKVIKDNVPPKVSVPVKDKKKQDKTPDIVKKGPLERKVAFPADDLRICVNELAKHYKVQTDLEACATPCPYTHSLGKRISENYRNLSEFGRQFAEQLFDDRFRGVFGANSTNSTVFVAIHTKSKILICLKLLISFINTATA